MTKSRFDPLSIGSLRAGYGIYKNRVDELTEKRDRFATLLVEAGDPSVHDCSAEAEAMWMRYRKLHDAIIAEPDKARKLELLDEYVRIGNAYDFPALSDA